MKKNLSVLLFVISIFAAKAQWTKASPNGLVLRKSSDSYYRLDIDELRQQLSRADKVKNSSVEVSIPSLDGKMVRYSVSSLPVMDEQLASQYQLGSYVGVGIDDPTKYIRFSVAPNDFQSMMIGNGKYEFIEPATIDKKTYSLHQKSSKNGHAFTCSTKENAESVERLRQLEELASKNLYSKSSNRVYHTLRLAMSVTGEYTAYFGGTAGAMAQINATLTRVNGVFEQEFNTHLNMITAPNLIFTSASSDPYSAASQMCKWNYELMNALHGGTYGVTDTDFDIGHLFGATGGGGNAGCIGCIGSNDVSTTSYTKANGGCGYAYISPNNYKGSGITSPASAGPTGDNFDIDYVAHEMGHQLGDYHTYSWYEGTGSNMEPGSGSTIMGYAGITGVNLDIQAHSDPYFHSRSIDEVQANLLSKTVDVETPITNNTPVVSALTSYTIPKSTPFVLTAVASDPDGDPLTYCWEQFDSSASTIGQPWATNAGISNNTSYANVLGKTTSGAMIRSLSPNASPVRYVPNLPAVLAGNVSDLPNWESTSSVARTTHFRVTVRDNRPAGQAQTAFANQTITVGAASAFTVNAASGVSGSPVILTWVVSGTTASPYNVANVKIDYTADNGATWNVLTASTPNSGSASVTFPSSLGSKVVVARVSAIGNIFYNVNKVTLTASLNTIEAGANGIQVFPNPASDFIHTKNVSPKATYEIYSATGQLVAKGEVKDGDIKISNLVKGYYIISFNNNGTIIKKKFIKE